MALIKREYIDQETVITAKNLNDIQDAIIALENGSATGDGTTSGGVAPSNLYLLKQGETLADVPDYVDVVIDPNAIIPDTGGDTSGGTTSGGGTISHEWDGTVLVITSASGTSSADLKGDTGPQGIQGLQGIPGIPGNPGPQGPAGATPVKGTDYFTEEDKDEMVERVVDAMPEYIPVILTSDFYGDELPAAGTPGRIFFKKVNS